MVEFFTANRVISEYKEERNYSVLCELTDKKERKYR